MARPGVPSLTVTVEILSGSVVVALAIVALTVLGLAIRSSERSAADARVDAQGKAGKIALDAATIATLTRALDDERARTRALDQALDDAATTGDVDGARDRVLRRWAQRASGAGADAADGGGAVAVPPGAAASPAGSGDGGGAARP